MFLFVCARDLLAVLGRLLKNDEQSDEEVVSQNELGINASINSGRQLIAGPTYRDKTTVRESRSTRREPTQICLNRGGKPRTFLL